MPQRTIRMHGISEMTLARLKMWAEPLEDDVDAAIAKVLDAAEAQKDQQEGGESFPQGMHAKDGAAIWVEAERKRQDRKWGGWDHDSTHSIEDWVLILFDRIDKLREADRAGIPYPIERRAIQLTAVGFAMLECLWSDSMERLAASLKARDPLVLADEVDDFRPHETGESPVARLLSRLPPKTSSID